jgi:hypothetical protein
MPGLNDFLSRIQTDHDFYFQFRTSPQKALAAYELSSEERNTLSEASWQLWNYLEKIGLGADSIAAPIGGGTAAGVDAPLTWRIHTTQTWRLNIDQSDSVESQFDHEASLERPEVRHALAQIHSANIHHERLAAISALIEHIQ